MWEPDTPGPAPLRQISLPAEQRRNISQLYNRRTLDELSLVAPNIPWVLYANKQLQPAGHTVSWAVGTGHWALGTGHWALGTGHWALGTDRSQYMRKLRGTRVKRANE